MDARSILARLRDRQPLAEAELAWFARGLADGTVSDAQAGAFAMAVLLNGLSETGRRDLTLAMRDSGRVLSWDLPGPVVDKHSTGGLGDCVSLLLAPALAACGAHVPMISGRGLGHTGGTLDKLEAIPGLDTRLDMASLQRLVAETGCAIVAASDEIAPADRRLYAVRDVTATVESIDLICASILSKKLAAGLDRLVLDVKVGTGAFMQNLDDARSLARALVDTARLAGCPTTALITDMNEPLAPAMGNALEVIEVMKVLSGSRRGRLHTLTVALGGELLAASGLAGSVEAGSARIAQVIENGAAAERLADMVRALGGPADLVDSWPHVLPRAPVIRALPAPRAGWLTRFDGVAMGYAVVGLGAGRMVESDRIDPAVGICDILPLGSAVSAGDTLMTIHAAREADADAAAGALLAAITIGDAPPPPGPLVIERID